MNKKNILLGIVVSIFAISITSISLASNNNTKLTEGSWTLKNENSIKKDKECWCCDK